MNPQQLLADLLDRFQSAGESALYVSHTETESWPPAFKQALGATGLLKPASPAKSLVCDGCEEQCLMPVNTIPGDNPRGFIVCETRDDVSRIRVHLEALKQWKLTSGALIKLLSESLDNPGQVSLIEEALYQIPLSDVITLAGDKLAVNNQALLSVLHPEDIGKEPSCFNRSGDGWRITYLNKTEFFGDSLGLKAISYLIANQGKEIPVAELQQSLHPNNGAEYGDVSLILDSSGLDSIGLSIGGLGDAGATLDAEAIASIKARILELEDNVEIARDAGNTEELANAEEELQELRHYLSSQLNHKGRPRREADSHKRMVDALSKNIRKAKDQIRKSWPELADHFDCIKTGASYIYSPNPKIEWN